MLRGPRLFTALAVTCFSLFVGVGAASPASASHQDPVIIVAGTFSPEFANQGLAQRMRNDGYRVYIYVLPNLGLSDINASARGLNTFADSVRQQTGAARVDLVGHSQGGLLARSYVKYYGGVSEVDSLVSLGTPHRGTYVANLVSFLGLGNCLSVTACYQMAIGSAYLNDLNAGDDTIGSVRYTTIRTTFDELVRPVDNATLYDGPVNVLVQQQCWARVVGHVGLIADGTVYSGVRQALEGRTSINLDCWAL